MFVPHTPEEIQEMLQAIGVEKIEDLFADIPEKFRHPKHIDLPPPMTEMEVAEELQHLAEANDNVRDHLLCFLGAGAYYHYIPSVIDHILRRGEFYTAYTPYQPEISQGTLHAIFEFQSMVAALTGMEVANASLYDGATAATVRTYYEHSDREVVVPDLPVEASLTTEPPWSWWPILISSGVCTICRLWPTRPMKRVRSLAWWPTPWPWPSSRPQGNTARTWSWPKVNPWASR